VAQPVLPSGSPPALFSEADGQERTNADEAIPGPAPLTQAAQEPAAAKPVEPVPRPSHPSAAAPPAAARPRAGAVRSTPHGPPKRPPSSPPGAPHGESQKAAAAAGPQAAEASIQLDPGMAAEVEAALPFESTLITRNPMLKPKPKAAPADPEKDDETTNPGVRNPLRR
jgi:hypothetical protein